MGLVAVELVFFSSYVALNAHRPFAAVPDNGATSERSAVPPHGTNFPPAPPMAPPMVMPGFMSVMSGFPVPAGVAGFAAGGCWAPMLVARSKMVAANQSLFGIFCFLH